MTGLQPNIKELIKPKKFDLDIVFKNLKERSKELENFNQYKLWYYKRRLKFLDEIIDLLFSNQDILQGESILFNIFCEEQKLIIDAINKNVKEKNEQKNTDI